MDSKVNWAEEYMKLWHLYSKLQIEFKKLEHQNMHLLNGCNFNKT